MLRLLPLCLLLVACGSDDPLSPPAGESAVAPDSDRIQDATSPSDPSEAEAPAERSAPVDPVLIDGHGGRAEWTEDGIEMWDESAISLADALPGSLYNAGGSVRTAMIFDGAAPSGALLLDDGDAGTWTLDGGTLILRTPALGERRYVITERSERGFTFDGPSGELRLEDTAG